MSLNAGGGADFAVLEQRVHPQPDRRECLQHNAADRPGAAQEQGALEQVRGLWWLPLPVGFHHLNFCSLFSSLHPPGAVLPFIAHVLLSRFGDVKLAVVMNGVVKVSVAVCEGATG